jgi:hypothetical protein
MEGNHPQGGYKRVMRYKVEVVNHVFKVVFPEKYRIHIQGTDYEGIKDAIISCRLTKKKELSRRRKFPDGFAVDLLLEAHAEWERQGQPDTMTVM